MIYDPFIWTHSRSVFHSKMQTFLFGINDGFINALADEIPKQINNIFQGIADESFAEGKKQEVFGQLASATPNIINQIIEKAQKQYLWPIRQSVATLPIEELAMLMKSKCFRRNRAILVAGLCISMTPEQRKK